MDNDLKGQEFDIKVFSALINRYNPNITIETSIKQDGISLNIQYSKKVSGSLNHHAAILEEKLTQDKKEAHSLDRANWFESAIKLQMGFPMNELAVPVRQKPETAGILLRTINALYLPFPTNIHKSAGKDWNDDLREYKEKKNKALKTTVNNLMPSP